MRPLRSLQPLEQLWAAGGAKGAGRRARSRKCDPCAAYNHWNNFGQPQAPRARGAGPGTENATPAQPTPIGIILGSRGRGAQGQEQKMRPLRSLQPLE